MDCWAAMQLSQAPDGERYLNAAIQHFLARGPEYHPKYGTGFERAKRIRRCAELAQAPPPRGEASIRLKIWPKQPGPTAMEAVVWIDGKRIGKISNLQTAQELRAGTLEHGRHTFRLEKINGYLVDPVGQPGTDPFVRGLACSGRFIVYGKQTFHLAAHFDGRTIVCGLHPGPVDVDDEEEPAPPDDEARLDELRGQLDDLTDEVGEALDQAEELLGETNSKNGELHPGTLGRMTAAAASASQRYQRAMTAARRSHRLARRAVRSDDEDDLERGLERGEQACDEAADALKAIRDINRAGIAVVRRDAAALGYPPSHPNVRNFTDHYKWIIGEARDLIHNLCND